MDLHVVLVGLAAVTGAGLVWLTATTATRPTARRAALLLAVAQVALFYAATADLLGRPKPIEVEVFESRLANAQVLAHNLRQDEAIFLWLRPAPGDDPIAYRLPWIERTARQLHAAGQKAEAEGGSVQFTVPGDDGTDGGEPSVGWVPEAALPPKPRR